MLRAGTAAALTLPGIAVFITMRALRIRRQRRHRAMEGLWHTIDGKRMRCHVARGRCPDASRPPVVLVHGLGVSSAYLLPAAEHLALHFDVYAPDLPGHGQSSTPDHPLDVVRLADALLTWMDRNDLQQVHLVGHSMGCQIAIEAALREPERVNRLVLIGPTLAPRLRAIRRLAPRFLLGGLFERPSLIPILIRDYLRMGSRVLPEFQAMRHYGIEQRLAQIRHPTLLVRGALDTLVPQAWLEKAGYLVRAARVAVIPGWGHAVQYSVPDKLVATILPFLTALDETAVRPSPIEPVRQQSGERFADGV